MTRLKTKRSWLRRWPAMLALYAVVVACASLGARDPQLHGWWKGLGPVMPHDSFPADCSLCHEGTSWQTLRADFSFDHEAETGVPLSGAHAQAQCLRCHNDRGPVATFQARSCAGCHEDIHQGMLGVNCSECHVETTWRPYGQVERHSHTRFPLVGAHAFASCRSCHLGNEVGHFLPVDTACVSCHRADLAATQNPNHPGLGWIDNCQKCHMPTSWQQALVAPQ